MAISSGARLGVYEVVAKLGEGGMGEVYRAKDSKLKREVAIKVLPADVASDHERMARFQREAEVLASLNHPHIAQIYGLEESNGVTALVMELVEGEDLSQVIGRGPIPLDEALQVAKQIAEALEAAHEQGIIHRDLKPANVKVRADGTVKVLDFGLAKALDQGSGIGDQGSGNLANSPTITTPAMTQAGIILGTAAYMSPEQARGKRVDKRADVWAFGVVLHEMLAGRRLFAGDELADVIAAVITREPDLSQLPAATPPGIRTLIGRCLTKDPQQRLRDIGDARWLLDHGAEPAALRPSGTSRWLRLAAIASSAALVVTIGGGTILLTRRSVVDTPSLHLSMTFADSVPQRGQPNPSLALSPDGRTLAYTAVGPEGTQLWVRHLNDVAARPIAGTGPSQSSAVSLAAVPRQAFFSPDGKWIGFVAGDEIKKVPAAMGPVATICRLFEGVRGATWTDQNEIVFAGASGDGGLWRVPAEGGTPVRVAEGQFHYPDALPGGGAVLVTSDSGRAERSASDLTIEAVTLATGARTRLFDGGTAVRYVPTGHLVFARDDALMAARFDAAALAAGEARETVVPDLWMDPAVSSGNYAFSATGTLVYAAGSSAEFSRRIVAITGDDVRTATPIVETRRYYSEPRLSPSGGQVAVVERAWRDRIWVIDLTRGTAMQLARGRFPVWAPNGREIAFGSGGATPGLSIVPADGGQAPTLILASQNLPIATSWSRDGRQLVFTDRSVDTGSDLMLLDLDRGGTVRPLLQTSSEESQGMVSPDGQLIAYQSGRSGTVEVYVSEFPSMRGTVQVSTDGGLYPVWAPNTRRVHYRSGAGVMAVDVAMQDSAIRAARPAAVATFVATYPQAFVDPMPDGRFLALEGSNIARLSELRVVVNWFTELRAKVP